MTDEDAAQRTNLCPTSLLCSMRPSGDDMLAGDLWLCSNRSSPLRNTASAVPLFWRINPSPRRTDGQQQTQKLYSDNSIITTITTATSHPPPPSCAGSVCHWSTTTAATTIAAASPTAAPASRRTACAPRPSHRMTAHHPQPHPLRPIIIPILIPPTTTTTITTTTSNHCCCCCRCLFHSISSLNNSFGMRWLSNMTTLSTLTTRSSWLPFSLTSSRAIRSTWML
jgi:hypothetical protein